MPRVGEILKQEREKRGLSLHEIGISLKINAKILKAIEDDDKDKLPARTFLRGFVRSYAIHLRLDPATVLKQLDIDQGVPTKPPTLISLRSSEDKGSPANSDSEESPETVDPEEPSASASSQEKASIAPASPTREISDAASLTSSAEDFASSAENVATENTKSPRGKPKVDPRQASRNDNRILLVLGLCTLFVMAVFVLKLIEKYQNESRKTPVTIKTEAQLPIPYVKEEPTPNIEPTPELENKLSESLPPNQSPMEIPASDKKADKQESTPNKDLLESKTPAKEVVNKIEEKPATVANEKTPEEVAKPTPAEPAKTVDRHVEVILEALNKVDIKYALGPDNPQKISMAAQEIHTFKSANGIVFEISDGGAVSLIVNGRENGVPGNIGKPIKLSYPK